MDKSEKKLRNRIAELRKHKGLTIQQVADGIGVSNGTISRYEKGSREPKLETWIKLASFFNVPVPYLQGISDDKISVHAHNQKSIGDTISIIYSLLIYINKHPNMNKIPEKVLSGIVLSKKAYNNLIDASMYIDWQSGDDISSSIQLIQLISSEISKDNHDVLNKKADTNDIENICLSFQFKAMQLFNNATIDNKTVIKGAIEGVNTALTVLNMRAFGENNAKLPPKVDSTLYHQLLQIFKDTKAKILLLSKKYDEK